MKSRREFIKEMGAASFALGTSAFFTQCAEKKTRPNIVFIMSDDHAEQAIGCYGHGLIQTPNIDRIAKEGVRFTNSFVTNSICAPSRAVLLTGKYSHLNGMIDNRVEFDGSQMTFPKLLRKNGYKTAIFGKWHLKTEPTGFDKWEVLVGQGEYYNPRFKTKEGVSKTTGYTTDIITDKAIDFMEKQDRENPFCMLVHHKAPHRNWMPPLKYLDKFEDTEFPLPETFHDDYKTREKTAGHADMRIDDMFMSFDMKLNPRDYDKQTGSGGAGKVVEKPQTYYRDQMNEEQLKVWDEHYEKVSGEFAEADLKGEESLKWKYQRYMRDYMACIASVDDNVGRILDYLDNNGLRENTIVVYTSDQGFYLGEHGWYDKRFMYEESLGMPLLARLPKEIAPGGVNEDMALNLDFAPTLLDYAGVAVPNDMQGRSLRPLLEGKTPRDWRQSMYYHYYEYPHGWHSVKKHYGVRTKDYKLIRFYGEEDIWEFYDLRKDPKELLNQYGNEEYQDVIQDLKKELIRLRKQYRDREPADL